MADWKRTLNLLPEWKQAQDGTISTSMMAGVISKRLLALRPFGGDEEFRADYEREVIAEAFEDLSTYATAGVEEFDELMADLYDWADTLLDDSGRAWGAKKACWVKTF